MLGVYEERKKKERRIGGLYSLPSRTTGHRSHANWITEVGSINRINWCIPMDQHKFYGSIPRSTRIMHLQGGSIRSIYTAHSPFTYLPYRSIVQIDYLGFHASAKTTSDTYLGIKEGQNYTKKAYLLLGCSGWLGKRRSPIHSPTRLLCVVLSA